jgi:hypothetical protein
MDSDPKWRPLDIPYSLNQLIVKDGIYGGARGTRVHAVCDEVFKMHVLI